MKILEMNAEYRSAATKADINGNGNGQLDKAELAVFVKEAAKNGSRSDMQRIVDTFGECTDELKTFMTKVEDLETSEKQLKEAKDKYRRLNNNKKESSERGYVNTASNGFIGVALGVAAGLVVAGMTSGSIGGPAGAIIGGAIGLGIGLYNGYSTDSENLQQSIARFEKEDEQEYNSYAEIIPELEKLVAKKKEALGI